MQVRLKVSAQGFPDSFATYSQKLLADGSKSSQMAIEISARDGRKVRVRLDRTYASSGAPVRVYSETSSDKPRYRKTATATFGAEGARVVIDENGNRTVKDVSLAGTAPRECAPEFWFLRDTPKVGASAKYYHFDIDKLEWRIVESTYIGPTTYLLAGSKVPAHRIRTTTGEAILDQSGAPLRVEDSAAVMVRIGASSS